MVFRRLRLHYRIAFTSWRDGCEAVYVATTDSSDVTRVSGNGLTASFASWSPDGTHLVLHGIPQHTDGLLGWLGR